jgi:hypothetical protein
MNAIRLETVIAGNTRDSILGKYENSEYGIWNREYVGKDMKEKNIESEMIDSETRSRDTIVGVATDYGYLSIYVSRALCWTSAVFFFFQFLNFFYTVDRTPWTEDQPVARPLTPHITTQTQNKRTQTSMPRVGFEPKIPVFEQEKTVHALDRAAAVISILSYRKSKEL